MQVGPQDDNTRLFGRRAVVGHNSLEKFLAMGIAYHVTDPEIVAPETFLEGLMAALYRRMV